MAYDVRFLSESDVAALGITMKEVISAVDAGWKKRGEGLVELPPKIGVHPRHDAYMHAMPCWVGGDVDMAGIKWVCGYPTNLSRKLPYNNGVFVLNSVETGVVEAIMDCNWMTTWRTGAAAGLGAKYFADPKSEVVAVVGLGTIGKITLRAFKETLPCMKVVKVYDPVQSQAEKYVEAMKDIVPGVTFEICKGYRDVCMDADVVTSCAPIIANPTRPVKADILKKNVFCMTSDYCSTFGAEVVSQGSSFVCDDKGQYLWTQEQGDYFQNGYPTESEIYADICEVAAGKKEPVHEGRRTCLFMGIAVNDVMTAKLIMEKAKEQNAGSVLKL